MVSTFSALCSDFYVNQKVALKLDLPTNRETVLTMFDRVRQDVPSMERLRRFDDEIALESTERRSDYQWMAMSGTMIRSGWVNPDRLERAYRLHRLILEAAPFYLSISPLDVEYIELVFGFDLETDADHNEVVFDALLADSALALLVDHDREAVIDAQPFFGLSLDRTGTTQAFLEVKTRSGRPDLTNGFTGEKDPISVYLTVRRRGPLKSVADFTSTFGTLAGHVERLSEERVLPHIVVPIRQALLSRPT